MNQIVSQFIPQKIILFGSTAKGISRTNSDIDLCIIIETTDKKELLTQMYLNIDSYKPIDFIVYTPYEWINLINDKSSFAHLINTKGID
ncbi:MAG: nucleotidyltransferase domain-containing protein, partial [Bacteroidota bacterium]